MDDNKNQQAGANESNAERDQDEGSMNNGTIGGSMGTIGSSNNDDEANNSKVQHHEGTNLVKGGADKGSKAGSRLGTGVSSDTAESQSEGSAAENI